MDRFTKLTDYPSSCLEDIISPLSASEFLETFWGRRFVHVRGSRDKFAQLFTWAQLNSALEQYPFEPPRLRLNKDGNEIAADRYLASEYLGGRGGIRRLRASELTKELVHGATLILNCAEELSSPLKEICIGLESIFRDRVIANLYAVFTSGHPYPLHWDSQDTLILQVFGRKKWTIYESTRPYPLREEQEAPPAPVAAAVWEGILEQGELFHIPRGWWHVAYPDEQPSLHLTVTVAGPTGLDLLRWCTDRLETLRPVISNAPLFESDENQKQYAEALKVELVNSLNELTIDRFLSHRDAWAIPRPKMLLPDAATGDPQHIMDTDWIRLASPRPLAISIESGGSTLTFECARKAWRCPAFLLPVMTLLNDCGKHRLHELVGTVNDHEQKAAARQFVHQLIRVGVLCPDMVLEPGQPR